MPPRRVEQDVRFMWRLCDLWAELRAQWCNSDTHYRAVACFPRRATWLLQKIIM